MQAAEEERMRIEDEERREWESAQGAGPRAEVSPPLPRHADAASCVRLAAIEDV